MTSSPRKTRRAWNEPGHAHFLTYSCYKRLPLLTRDASRRWAIEAMDGARRSHDFAIWAYVIMPEHVHVLICPRTDRYEMKSILGALKRPVAVAARRHLVSTGQTKWLDRLTEQTTGRAKFRFWQPGGGFDHNIFQERTVSAVVDYIHANPVRRGLVFRATDWRWSSAGFWDGDRDATLVMDNPADYWAG
ncbi:MAG: transposase [Phycisphaerales bacterium]|nr:transposase [Phycisphaerales bacterium]